MTLTKLLTLSLKIPQRALVHNLSNITCNHFLHKNLYASVYHPSRRNFSLQSTFDSIARTQSGVFQALSESAPVEQIQNLLLHFHNETGLPWWASVVCTTIILRTVVTLPLSIYQQYITARISNLNKEMPAIVTELKKEMAVAIRKFNWDEKTAKYYYRRSLKKQWDILIVRDNCHPLKTGLVFLFQIPLWICFSVSLRNLVYELPKQDLQANITMTELTVGGFGWIPNLVAVDASLIFPISFGLLNLILIEIQSLSRVNPMSRFQKFMTYFFYGFSILMIPIAASVPSCLVLYWTTSTTLGLVQNLMLYSPKFKRLCRIPHSPIELSNPYSHILNKAKQKYLKINQQI